jgi:hypothetical protein
MSLSDTIYTFSAHECTDRLTKLDNNYLSNILIATFINKYVLNNVLI